MRGEEVVVERRQSLSRELRESSEEPIVSPSFRVGSIVSSYAFRRGPDPQPRFDNRQRMARLNLPVSQPLFGTNKGMI